MDIIFFILFTKIFVTATKNKVIMINNEISIAGKFSSNDIAKLLNDETTTEKSENNNESICWNPDFIAACLRSNIEPVNSPADNTKNSEIIANRFFNLLISFSFSIDSIILS